MHGVELAVGDHLRERLLRTDSPHLEFCRQIERDLFLAAGLFLASGPVLAARGVYRGRPLLVRAGSSGWPMQRFADTKMQECRKKRDGKTGMAMKAGSSRMSDTQYEDSDISAASNSRLRSILKNV